MSDQNQPGQAPQPQPEPSCAGMPDGWRPDLSAHIITLAGNNCGRISDDMARLMMTDVANFLRQVVSITSHVVQSISVGQLRRIVGPELAKSIGLVDENGKVVTELKDPEPADAAAEPKRDHRKGPRGGKHPLVALIQIALQAGKLLERITRGTNPDVYNLERIADRIARNEQRHADKLSVPMFREFAGIAKNLDASVSRAEAIKR